MAYVQEALAFLNRNKVPNALTSALGRCLWRGNSQLSPSVQHRMVKCIEAYTSGQEKQLAKVYDELKLAPKPRPQSGRAEQGHWRSSAFRP